MSKNHIVIGEKPAGGQLRLDVWKFILTRLLVTANSGGGKSWLIRRLCEQLFSIMPVMIIDPEGEFATLREKFGFVLVGKGGETPADSRSANLVMHKLLELRASAVFDLYELSHDEKHNYVKLICNAAINAPKNLWRPTTFVFDEVHEFCPEAGKGESPARAAVLAFPTKGRKRRFGSIFSTQALAKLAKDARREFQNRMVGQTFEPDDLKVAASILGIAGKIETDDFNKMMRTMDTGNFFAFGRAICLEQTLVKVGPVETSHEVEDAKHGNEPPPPPEKVRELLPQLADLPKQAEEKAQTEAHLKNEVRRLTQELARALKAAPSPPTNSPELKDENRRLTRALEQAMKLIVEISTRNFDPTLPREEVEAAIKTTVDRALVSVEQKLTARNGEFSKLKKQAESVLEAIKRVMKSDVVVKLDVNHNKPFTIQPTSQPSVRRAPASDPAGNGTTSKCQRKVLAVLSQYPDEGCNMSKLALLAGYSIGGGFRNELGGLRTLGLMSGQNTELMRITTAGLDEGPFEPMPQGQARLDFWLNHPRFSKCMRQVLQVLLEHPDGLSMEQLAEKSGYSVGGGFRNELGALRTAGVMVGKNTELMRPSETLFE